MDVLRHCGSCDSPLGTVRCAIALKRCPECDAPTIPVEDVTKAVKVVPASQLRGAVEKLEQLLEPTTEMANGRGPSSSRRPCDISSSKRSGLSPRQPLGAVTRFSFSHRYHPAHE